MECFIIPGNEELLNYNLKSISGSLFNQDFSSAGHFFNGFLRIIFYGDQLQVLIEAYLKVIFKHIDQFPDLIFHVIKTDS